MNKEAFHKFNQTINKLEGKEYLLSVIAYNIAPTLKRIKPSCLLAFSTHGRNMHELWESYKYEVCKELNIQFFEIKHTEERNLVLFYDDTILNAAIQYDRNKAFLMEIGYQRNITLEESLQKLKKRFEEECPHEIGIFLGIPLEDVKGFITKKGIDYIFCNYWKVYHNPKEAKQLFKKYDHARVSILTAILNVNTYDRNVQWAV